MNCFESHEFEEWDRWQAGVAKYFFISYSSFSIVRLIKKWEGKKSVGNSSITNSCRTFSAKAKQEQRNGNQQERERNVSSLDKKSKTEVKSGRNTDRNEIYGINYSLDLKAQQNRSKVYRSLNLDEDEGREGKSRFGKNIQGNNYNCMTISPWLKERDHPILKREKNLFDYYMNEIKRKREERTLSKKLKQQQSHSPFIITSVQDSRQITDFELTKMEEMYRNWKNNNRMLVSGRAITIKKSKKPTPAKIDNHSIDKKLNGHFASLYKQKEDGEIQAWENDVKLDKDEPQF